MMIDRHESLTTHAGNAKKTSAELDDDDNGLYSGDNDNNDSNEGNKGNNVNKGNDGLAGTVTDMLATCRPD